MSDKSPIPAFFHEDQLSFKPLYEWAFGERIDHPETTARAESILAALRSAPEDFVVIEPPEVPLSALRQLHSYNLMTLYNTAKQLPESETFFPTVFPKRGQNRGDPTNIHHAGCFCFDAGTPLNAQTWTAASWSAACAKAAAVALQRGKGPLTYALSRPPGHHATRDLFGGYSYFNNTALAAKHLRRYGRVAVLDVDFHHGNGTQQLFYKDPQVLTISVHGDPRVHYPYFAGFAEETGAGPGVGYNINLPLDTGCNGRRYLQTLRRHVIPAIKNFVPDFLVLAAGLDAYVKDPVGHFSLEPDEFFDVGKQIGRLKLPTAVIQEGGYYAPDLGMLAVTLLRGLREGMLYRRSSRK